MALTGDVYAKQREVIDYFMLSQTNEELAYQNAILQELIIKGRSQSQPAFLSINSCLSNNDIHVIPAKVVNASVNQQHNLLTINVGSNDSVAVDMAVIGPLGVVGVVKSVSRNYAMVLPLVNAQNRVSSKLSRSNYYGSLRWNTSDYRYASLEGIEEHVKVQVGDTVSTSGFGAIYPEGVMVGTVSAIEDGDEGVFHKLEIALATDFKRLSYVYVLHTLSQDERVLLEDHSTKN